HYMALAATELNVEPKSLAPAVLERLACHDWPGNVRELVNLCRRLSVVAPGSNVQPQDLPAELMGAAPASDDWAAALTGWAERQAADGSLLATALPQFERALVGVALRRTGGHRQQAAKLLGWGRNTLARKIRELGVTAPGE
ncbi:MAG: nitrogen regulation protein NR(I), partial [Gammaproteobacteria bacterium]|nr:nitrogen regulation protein NR(I) [Gammaproteobacteria bacterium]